MKYCYTLCTVLAVLSILINLSGGLPEAAAQNVDFPDTNLAAAVRDALNLGATDPIPQTDLARLTLLSADNAGISNLTGLEQATSLTTLWLFSNQISDISALSGLTNLTSLNLGSNQIRDISALSGLTNLTSLYLQSNQISDISVLSGLTNLTLLNLGSNQISDISALSGLTNLMDLSLDSNRISDISALSGLTKLTSLSLDGKLSLDSNAISDISALSGLTNLMSLSLFSNAISDISALSGLTNLTTLWLSFNQIRDISALSGLTNLTSLSLELNQISEISVLSGLTNLTTLYLEANQISDISALSGLTNLMDLDIANNEIRDISVLSGLTNLTSLSLSSNQISDISALSGLTNIEWLDISDNEIRDISPLSTLSSLTTLIIDIELDENNPGLLARILPSNIQISFRLRFRQTITNFNLGPRIAVTPAPERNRLKHCGLGWTPHSQYPPQLEQPKVMIYALEFEFNQNRYTCSAIEIRTGDATISHLDGWQLYLGTLYNPSRIPIKLTQENSQITDNVLRLTPDLLGQQTFACSNVNMLGFPLPSVHYVLKNANGVIVDRAYSCYIFGQSTYTQVNGEWVESQRRISGQALQSMDIPRIERYITNETGIYITYIPFEKFGWDRVVLSDWLLASSEETEVAGGNAPSSPYKKLATSWAALKKPGILRRNEKRR